MTDDFPGVEITTSDAVESYHEPVAYHVDDVDGIEGVTGPTYVYLWETEREEREQQLLDVIDELKNNYIFATGIEYATELQPLVPLEPDQLTVYAWLVRLGLWEDHVDCTDEAVRLIHEAQKQL